MNLAEIQAEVYSLTNRPDLVGDTLVAIRAATLKMHHTDFYYKDICEAVLNLQTASYVNSFETSLLANYRAMAFIRKWYPEGIDLQTGQATGRAAAKLTPVDFNSVMDSYGRDKNDVYYIAGRSVNMKLADALATFLVAWYKHPVVSSASFSSWIAEEHPYAIVYDAAATVFKGIGYDEQATRFGGLVAEQVAMIKLSNIEIEGR